MQKIGLALSLTLACASHTSSISVVPGSEQKLVRPAAGPSEKPLEVRSFRITVPAAKPLQYDILLAWEPTAGTYWWVWQAPSDDPGLEKFPGRGTTLFTGDGRIAVIIPQTPPTLHFRASAKHASSIERAREEVLAEIERDPALLAGPQSTMVSLTPPLDVMFGGTEGMASAPPMTIERVSHAGGRWLITLRGYNGDRADVTLTDDYKLIDLRRYR